MFITTAGRTTDTMINLAKNYAEQLQVPYVERRKCSVALLQSIHEDSCMVIGKERLELYSVGETSPFFFHPNSAMFRIKRLMRGESDPFVDACQLKSGMSFLDCTLGLASDSIVASYKVGSTGLVTGLETEKQISFIVQKGLQTWMSGIEEMDEAMQRIIVHHINCFDFLKTLPSSSVDCVYFDPMFDEQILESDGIHALSNFASYIPLQADWISEALRVSKGRVVLKDHYLSERFQKFGFKVLKRKTAKFHYGIIEK